MKFFLIEQIDSKKYVNRDQMGGLGIAEMPRTTPIVKLFGRIKRNFIVVPLYALAQIAACLKKNDHEVKVFNGDKLPENESPDAFILPSSMVGSNDECKLGTRLKLNYPNSKVIFFGPFASYYSDKYLMHGDLVVQGEPENFFLSLNAKDKIPTGTVKSPLPENLDALPFPAWEFFKLDQYRYSPALTKKPIVTMLASRSCIYTCKYCPYPVVYGAYRERSIDSIMDEITRLIQDLGVKSILFRDPLFLVKHSHMIEFIEAVKRKNLKFDWVCETRIEYFTEDILRDLRSIGLKGINCGIEALTPEVLNTQRRKDVTIGRYNELASLCRDIGIWITGFYIIGFLKETPDTIQFTLEQAKRINLPIVQFTINTPIPLSDDFTEFEPLLTEANWDYFSFYNLTYDHPNFSKSQIQAFQSRVLRDYYFRIDYWASNLKYFANRILAS